MSITEKIQKERLLFPENIKAKAVYVTDLKEDIIKALPFSDGKVPLEMAHYEIKTIYIEL